jgi:hypothetical protein
MAQMAAWDEIKENLSKIGVELVTTVGLLLVLKIIHVLTEWFFGEGARFFGKLPVIYVFDVGDIILIGKFIWRSIRKFNA